MADLGKRTGHKDPVETRYDAENLVGVTLDEWQHGGTSFAVFAIFHKLRLLCHPFWLRLCRVGVLIGPHRWTVGIGKKVGRSGLFFEKNGGFLSDTPLSENQVVDFGTLTSIAID